MIRIFENRPVLTVAIIAMIMLGVSFHFFEVSIMEARNFITAREMLSDGNWILTTMNGEPRYQKPPLPTWITAFLMLIFGAKNVVMLRLPGIVMVIVVGIGSYFLSRQLIQDKGHALVNSLITITSFYVVAIVIEAPWDIFSHGFMLIGIYQLFQLFKKDKSYWKNTILAGIFIGASIMCKGPISVYALLLPFLISYGIIYKYDSFKSKAFSMFSVLLLAISIGGWWYLYIKLEDTSTFMEITKHETTNWSSYNVRPFYYYWSFFTQSGIWTIPAFIGLLYPYMKSRVRDLKAYKFTLLWTLLAVVLLSIIPEKKSRYLMPVLIPLALNTGFYIDYLIRKFVSVKNKKEIIPIYFNFGLIALIALAFPIFGYLFLKDFQEPNWALFVVSSVIMVGLGIGLIKQIFNRNMLKIFYLTIVFVVAAFVLLSPFSVQLKGDSYKSVSGLHEALEKENLKLFKLDAVSPEMIWQYGDKIPPIKIDDSTFSFPKEKKFALLVGNSDLLNYPELRNRFELKFMETYDLNSAEPESNKYRDRLVNRLYYVTQK